MLRFVIDVARRASERVGKPLDTFQAVAKRLVPDAFDRFQAEEATPKKKPKPTDAKVIQLPIWPEPERAAPNSLIRSALFSAVSDKSKRPMLREKQIASWGDMKLQYSGALLTQYDADVWHQLLHLHRIQAPGNNGKVFFSTRSFLKILNKRYSGYAANTLADSINRLCVCKLGAQVGSAVVVSSRGLVKKYGRDDTTGRWCVELEPEALALFDDGHTRISWEDRLKLRSATARYLQWYVSSHHATKRHPHRIGLPQLKGLCGQRCTEKRFRRQIREAMIELEKLSLVSGWGFTASGALEFSKPKQAKQLNR